MEQVTLPKEKCSHCKKWYPVESIVAFDLSTDYRECFKCSQSKSSTSKSKEKQDG